MVGFKINNMAHISIYVCDNCGLSVNLYGCSESETMIRDHNNVSRKKLLCSSCGDVSTYYNNTYRRCPKCNHDKLVGLNSNKCPNCPNGEMKDDPMNDPAF